MKRSAVYCIEFWWLYES